MYPQVFVFTCIFVGCVYKLNGIMLHKLKKRHARIEGNLDAFLEEEEKERAKGFIRRNFGKIGGGDDDGLEGGIKLTSIGGAWNLKTLDGNPLGSKDLEGRHYLIYFGSSLCPDVCPYTLRSLMKAMRIIKNTSEGK